MYLIIYSFLFYVEKKQFRDWGAELNVKLTEMCYNHSADQRISVISNTSSNTTSGIVSDRVQSLDESEGKFCLTKLS